MSCSRMQHSAACSYQTQDLSIRSLILCLDATGLPLFCVLANFRGAFVRRHVLLKMKKENLIKLSIFFTKHFENRPSGKIQTK